MQSHDREESQYLTDWKEQHEQSLEDLFVPVSPTRAQVELALFVWWL